MTASKDTNPKDAIGTKKVYMGSVLPVRVLGEMSLGMLEGALKYGRHNYREAGVRGSVYFDAALRHLYSWWEGQDTDPDSGLPHITKALCCLLVMRDSQLMRNFKDDRPPRYPDYDEWVTQQNKTATVLVEKCPDPVPAFVHLVSDLEE